MSLKYYKKENWLWRRPDTGVFVTCKCNSNVSSYISVNCPHAHIYIKKYEITQSTLKTSLHYIVDILFEKLDVLVFQ